MKKYEGVETELHVFLTSVPDGGKWSYSRNGHFTVKKGAIGRGSLGVEKSQSDCGGGRKNLRCYRGANPDSQVFQSVIGSLY
jgi:hypothetical protein